MGGKTISTTATKIANIQLQTSTYGLGVPIQYGTNRGAGNLIWFGDFKAIPHTETTKAGKGLGQVTTKNTTYTYTAAVMMAIAEGPITAIGKVWKGKEQSSLSALGLTLLSGTSGQAVWSYLTSYNVSGNWGHEVAYGYADQNPAFTDQKLGYDTTAILAASAYDLGGDATIPNHGFEVHGMCIVAHGAGNEDAKPGDVVADFLTEPNHGVPSFLSSYLGDLTLFRQYTEALGMFISPRVEDRKPASDYLKEWLDALNTDPLWSSGKLKLLPRGDTALSGNGQTYTPNLTPIYDLDSDAFLANDQGPVRVTRKTPADAYNIIQIEFRNRTNDYNVEVVTVPDDNAIELYGPKPAPMVQMHFLCDSDKAKIAGQLLLQRSLYLLNDYSCGVTSAYDLLEPGDLVTLTDYGQSLYRQLVRITKTEEEDEGTRISCEELLVGTAAAALYPHDNGLRYVQNLNASPQSAAVPFIFELPADADTTGLALGIAVGAASGDPLYGGSNVWASLDDTSYQLIGTIHGSSRYGALTASLSSSGSPLSLHLTSGGQLPSVSSTEASAGMTMLTMGAEYLSYTTATLTGADAYNLTGLYRGLYESGAASHSSSAHWARVDDALCRLTDMDLSLIGKTVHIKCTAFNTYGGGEQALSDVSSYPYTITGYMQALGAKAQLAKIGEDGWLTPAEKQIVINDYAVAVAEKSSVDTKADDLGFSRVAYDTAYTALTSYLGGLSPAWNDTTQATPITRATWNAKWTDFEDARRALLVQIQGQPGADGTDGTNGIDAVTLDITKASIAVSADYTGTVTSALPVSNKATLISGSTDVTSSATLSISGTGASATIDASGNVSLTAVSAVTGVVTVTAVYGGHTYTKSFATVRNDDPQPPTTATSVSDNGTTAISSGTSFSTPISGIWTVAANGSGNLIFDAGANAVWSSTSGTKDFTLGIECGYRIAGSGGSWTVFGAGEQTGDGTAIPGEPGSLTVSISGYTQTGLTAGQAYEVALFAEKVSGAQSSVNARWNFTVRQT